MALRHSPRYAQEPQRLKEVCLKPAADGDVISSRKSLLISKHFC